MSVSHRTSEGWWQKFEEKAVSSEERAVLLECELEKALEQKAILARQLQEVAKINLSANAAMTAAAAGAPPTPGSAATFVMLTAPPAVSPIPSPAGSTIGLQGGPSGALPVAAPAVSIPVPVGGAPAQTLSEPPLVTPAATPAQPVPEAPLASVPILEAEAEASPAPAVDAAQFHEIALHDVPLNEPSAPDTLKNDDSEQSGPGQQNLQPIGSNVGETALKTNSMRCCSRNAEECIIC